MNKPKKRAYLQMWTDPLITVGKASFTDWLVSAAGGINIFGDMPFDSRAGQFGIAHPAQSRSADFSRRARAVCKNAAEAARLVVDPRRARLGHFCFIDEPDIRRSIDVHRWTGKDSRLSIRRKASELNDSNGIKVNRTRWSCLLIGLSLLVSGFPVALSIGPVRISLFDMSATDKVILFNLRLPRILSAFFVGGGLALAGAIFQGLFRNPIADSYLLGVSSGASLGAAATIVFRLASPLSNFAAVSFFAFVGSLGACSGVLFRPSQWQILDLPPAAFGLGRRSLSFFAGRHLHAHGRRRTQSADFFLSRRLFQLQLGYHLGFPCVHSSRRSWPPVTSLPSSMSCLLGEETAESSGIRTGRIQLLYAILAALLTSISVSVAGLIGFVGLIVPHMIRLTSGADHRTLFPLAFFAGGMFLVLCDAAARTIISRRRTARRHRDLVGRRADFSLSDPQRIERLRSVA